MVGYEFSTGFCVWIEKGRCEFGSRWLNTFGRGKGELEHLSMTFMEQEKDYKIVVD